MPRSKPKPTRATIRSYQVGFGDCFLMSVHYDEDPAIGDRHVLIDFGSTALPKYKPKRSLKQIALAIEAVTAGKLHGVVATHRHKDHISGFAGSAGEVIRSLQPDVVVQPWTEDPQAQPDAVGPAPASRAGLHLAALSSMQGVARFALDEVGNGGRGIAKTVRTEIEFIGDDNLTNRAAVENLATMAPANAYVHYGMKSGLEPVLPGVKIHVLGPPSLAQTDEILQQRSRDTDEFWHFQSQAGRRAARGRRLFAAAKTKAPSGSDLPIETRWFLPRLRRIRGEQLLQIVRALDHAMNNTSLILLFEISRRKFLFSGDAQIENWLYCLDNKDRRKKEKARRLLAGVDFYKVGHHGSLNATPKTLWNLFENRGEEGKPGRMAAVVSTMAGKHGSASRGTEVPRRKLTDALKAETDYRTTQQIRKKEVFCHEQSFDA